MGVVDFLKAGRAHMLTAAKAGYNAQEGASENQQQQDAYAMARKTQRDDTANGCMPPTIRDEAAIGKHRSGSFGVLSASIGVLSAANPDLPRIGPKPSQAQLEVLRWPRIN
jgi:hypothetical protein